MVIHDFSTTISCEICSHEFTVCQNLSEKAMRKVAKNADWKVIGGKDVCPHCIEAGRAEKVKEEE